MEKINDLLKDIKGVTCTASRKDEVRIMRAMMNDRDYVVTVYDKDTQTPFCPSDCFRGVCASVMSSAARMPYAEAEEIMNNYEFKKSEAEDMIDFSKEFINTYLHTGRKLPLGGREKSCVSLALKHIKGGTRPYPKKIGIYKDGKPQYTSGTSYVKDYDSIRVIAPAPSWL